MPPATLFDDDAAQRAGGLRVPREPLIRPDDDGVRVRTAAVQVLPRRVQPADNPAGDFDAAPGPHVLEIVSDTLAFRTEARVEVVAVQHSLDDLLDGLEGAPLLLVLDGIQDPHNLGACLRSADAAGVQAVILPRDNSAPTTPVVSKVASGAAETVPLFRVTNLARALDQLREAGVWLVGAAGETDQTLFSVDLTGPLALVLGAEGEGLRRLTREKCDHLVRIPMAGTVESLNVSVAAGICLFEAVRQRQKG